MYDKPYRTAGLWRPGAFGFSGFLPQGGVVACRDRGCRIFCRKQSCSGIPYSCMVTVFPGLLQPFAQRRMPLYRMLSGAGFISMPAEAWRQPCSCCLPGFRALRGYWRKPTVYFPVSVGGAVIMRHVLTVVKNEKLKKCYVEFQ